MSEFVKPEIQVIADNLYAIGEEKDRVREAEGIWAALLVHWTNRGKDNMHTSSPFLDGGIKENSLGLEFEDGNQGIPVPDFDREDGSFKVNIPSLNDKMKISHEDFVMTQLEAMYELIFGVMSLPMWNDKERVKLDKIAVKLGKVIAEHDHNNC